MNDKQLEKKVRHDTEKVVKEVNNLVKDRAAQLSRLENNVSHAAGKATEDISSWMGNGIKRVSKRLNKLTGGARGTLADTAASVKKDVGHTLSQYNAKAQKAVDKAPNGLSKKIARYPWVVISIGLALGFLVGNMIRPARRPIEQF